MSSPPKTHGWSHCPQDSLLRWSRGLCPVSSPLSFSPPAAHRLLPVRMFVCVPSFPSSSYSASSCRSQLIPHQGRSPPGRRSSVPGFSASAAVSRWAGQCPHRPRLGLHESRPVSAPLTTPSRTHTVAPLNVRDVCVNEIPLEVAGRAQDLTGDPKSLPSEVRS